METMLEALVTDVGGRITDKHAVTLNGRSGFVFNSYNDLSHTYASHILIEDGDYFVIGALASSSSEDSVLFQAVFSSVRPL
jgi:hypothetical protein